MSGDDSGVEDGLDDDVWLGGAEGDPEPRRGISPLVIVLGAVAVLGVIIVLLATGGGSDGDGKTSGSGSEPTTESADGAKTDTTVKRGPSWPAIVQGRPAAFGKIHDPITAVSDDAAPGVYLWVDYDGWHIWVVDPNGKSAAKGTITSNADFGDATLAAAGEGTVTAEGTTLAFDFAGASASAAGANFNPGFYANELTVGLQGTDLPLLLGKQAKPSPLPLVISKQVQPS